MARLMGVGKATMKRKGVKQMSGTGTWTAPAKMKKSVPIVKPPPMGKGSMGKGAVSPLTEAPRGAKGFATQPVRPYMTNGPLAGKMSVGSVAKEFIGRVVGGKTTSHATRPTGTMKAVGPTKKVKATKLTGRANAMTRGKGKKLGLMARVAGAAPKPKKKTTRRFRSK